MIKSIKVVNYLNEELLMTLKDPEKSGFYVIGIDGLGPCKADINTTEMATNDGAEYNSARVNSRNIVLEMIFAEIPSVEYYRQLTYKYFPLKRKLKIVIETDNRVCETIGYVESNEPTIFSSKEGTQISIICPDPNLYSTGETGTISTVFSGVEPAFEFPFSNESVTDKLLEFGRILSVNQKNIYYPGDIEVGVTIQINTIGTVKDISVYNRTAGQVMKIVDTKVQKVVGSSIKSGDEIVINTTKGNKYIVLIRDGKEYNILSCLDKKPAWFTLNKGDNIFAFTAEYGEEYIYFNMENRVAYEGI